MLSNSGDIAMLLTKYVQGGLSPQEKEQLDEWVNADPANKTLFDDLTQPETFSEGVAEYSRVVGDYLARRNKREVAKIIRMHAKRSPAQLIFIRAAASVAAAVLILFAVRIFYVQNKGPQTKEVAVNNTTSRLIYEIPPAGDKATLTLSSGQRIVLNDVTTGEMVKDGKIVIRKRQDGELMYEASVTHGNASLNYNTVTTPRGGKYQVVLPDGSKVWLNAATALRFPTSFSDKERLVELTGEAYFEVAKDKSKPFKVTMAAPGDAGNRQTIEVLGTHFNVGAYPDDQQTNATLLEGSIRLVTNEKATFLKPGQQALMDKGTGGIKIISPDDPLNSIAWVKGKFAFYKTPVANVMRELSRWYDIQVIYEGNTSPTTLFTGEVDRTFPLAKLLSYLEKMGHTRFSVEGRTVRVKA